jgi:hypothetical protein
MIDEYGSGKDLEGSICGLIEVLYHHVPGGSCGKPPKSQSV